MTGKSAVLGSGFVRGVRRWQSRVWVSVGGVEVPPGSVASRGRGELCTMLEILVLSLSQIKPSSSDSEF